MSTEQLGLVIRSIQVIEIVQRCVAWHGHCLMDNLRFDHPAPWQQVRFSARAAAGFARRRRRCRGAQRTPEIGSPKFGVVHQSFGVEVVGERLDGNHARDWRAQTRRPLPFSVVRSSALLSRLGHDPIDGESQGFWRGLDRAPGLESRAGHDRVQGQRARHCFFFFFFSPCLTWYEQRPSPVCLLLEARESETLHQF